MQGTLNYSNLPLFELYITLDVFIKKSVKMGLYGGYGNHDFSPSLRPLGWIPVKCLSKLREQPCKFVLLGCEATRKGPHKPMGWGLRSNASPTRLQSSRARQCSLFWCSCWEQRLQPPLKNSSWSSRPSLGFLLACSFKVTSNTIAKVALTWAAKPLGGDVPRMLTHQTRTGSSQVSSTFLSCLCLLLLLN